MIYQLTNDSIIGEVCDLVRKVMSVQIQHQTKILLEYSPLNLAVSLLGNRDTARLFGLFTPIQIK
jgi:hypothetical protein